MKTSKQTQPMAYTFIAMSVTFMLSLPVLERTHTHNSQILEANCEICLQLSAADNLLPEHFINEWPVTTRQFNVANLISPVRFRRPKEIRFKLNHKNMNIFVTAVGIQVFWYQWAGDRPRHWSRQKVRKFQLIFVEFPK